MNRHQTYKELSADGASMYIGCWQCTWRIRYDYDGELIQYVPDRVIGFERIAYETEIQAALDAGLNESDQHEFVRIGTEYGARHHWCINRECDGTGNGSCGFKAPDTEVAPR